MEVKFVVEGFLPVTIERAGQFALILGDISVTALLVEIVENVVASQKPMSLEPQPPSERQLSWSTRRLLAGDEAFHWSYSSPHRSLGILIAVPVKPAYRLIKTFADHFYTQRG